MFKDIVLAVTPSEVCEHAADKAFGFAQRFESNLTIVHVTGMEQGWGQMEWLEPSGETGRIQKNIEEFYSEKLKGLQNYQIKVVAGIPHNEILRISRQANADLIIMGPHTREHKEKRSKMWGMAGSTLERVSQRARCPVMIVTREAPYGEQRIARLLAATDFSKQAECAVAYGGQLCRHYNAGLTVLHVLEDSHGAGSPRLAAEAKERLQCACEPVLRGLGNVCYECLQGQPAMEILKFARMRDVDLILMAHHSKEEDPEEAFLGSSVVQVALNSACPTMSVNRHFDLRCGLMYDQTGSVTPMAGKSETAV